MATTFYRFTGGATRSRPAEVNFPAQARLIDDDHGTFTYEGGRQCEITYQLEADRGYASHGMLWSAGFFTVELRPHRPATLIASTEPWETMLALKPGQAFAADAERRRRLIGAAHPQAREGAGGGTRPRRGPIHHHARRPRRGCGAGARGGRRSAHGHRGVPLVYRLGPGYRDQPGRAHAHHRPAP